jgi:hypothetical protein
VVREIWEVRAVLIQCAHQHDQSEWAVALQRAVRGSNAATDYAVDAARRLEALGTPRPLRMRSSCGSRRQARLSSTARLPLR